MIRVRRLGSVIFDNKRLFSTINDNKDSNFSAKKMLLTLGGYYSKESVIF